MPDESLKTRAAHRSAVLPPQLLARAARCRVGLEVGAGARFETSLALAETNPRARWWVTDVDARVLDAPAPLRAHILDVTRPTGDWSNVDLVTAVRLPEELQASALRFARSIRADLAIRALKDEWAEISDIPARQVAWPGGWRWFPIE